MVWRWPRWHASITIIPLASNSGFSKRIGARFVNVSLLSSAQSVLDKKSISSLYQIGLHNFFLVLEQIIHFNPKLLFSSHYTCRSKAIGSRKISPRRKDFHSFDVEVEDLKSVELCFFFIFIYKREKFSTTSAVFGCHFSLFFVAFCAG